MYMYMYIDTHVDTDTYAYKYIYIYISYIIQKYYANSSATLRPKVDKQDLLWVVWSPWVTQREPSTQWGLTKKQTGVRVAREALLRPVDTGLRHFGLLIRPAEMQGSSQKMVVGRGPLKPCQGSPNS